ncbi:response regulator [Qipengyuania sp. DY56-A-20]|uniref:Response regulator n=1 Tax=Qipengyuania benthica TaxID=3067651 RepID=A0ABT9H9C1_9SPHN|nr:response regulator [Qipengyuania sp. DY56-A-20]MBU1252837.1 response regulator [Alphaproteobacteria bacterium]MBU1607469.1 response regulator [Alphaproteobacteria bacterium]MDP4539922.1 response regulator [Qipengyuania sp. DY56-A-20]
MRQPTILVAEDESMIGWDLRNTVEEAGYAVEGPFVDISSAMLSYQKHKPDLAILDVQLSDGNVFPLAEKLMAENIPVIFHSGNYQPDEVHKRFPGSTSLAKPCPPAAIIDSVHQALGD